MTLIQVSQKHPLPDMSSSNSSSLGTFILEFLKPSQQLQKFLKIHTTSGLLEHCQEEAGQFTICLPFSPGGRDTYSHRNTRDLKNLFWRRFHFGHNQWILLIAGIFSMRPSSSQEQTPTATTHLGRSGEKTHI